MPRPAIRGNCPGILALETDPSFQSFAQIDALMDRASAALADTQYCRAEAQCLRALRWARRLRDYDRMARIVLPLQEARRQRRLAAIDAGVVVLIESSHDVPSPPQRGCYLVMPPMVAADARQIRDRALEREVAVVVVAREPMTRAGPWPIVAAGPGVVVRCLMTPPPGVVPDPSRPARDKIGQPPEPAWFARAAEALSEAAIARVEPDRPVAWIVDDVLELLDAHPDDERLHPCLQDACRRAAVEPDPGPRPQRPLVDDPCSF